jgi:hypothetical protein
MWRITHEFRILRIAYLSVIAVLALASSSLLRKRDRIAIDAVSSIFVIRLPKYVETDDSLGLLPVTYSIKSFDWFLSI